MTQIELRFLPRHELAMRGGQKHGTLRRSVHGKPGDVFQAFDCWFEVDAIEAPVPALDAAHQFYEAEGEPSPEDVMRVLTEAYAEEIRVGTPLYFHRFHRISAAQAEETIDEGRRAELAAQPETPAHEDLPAVPPVPGRRVDGADFPLGF